jgi:hypothetical protein
LRSASTRKIMLSDSSPTTQSTESLVYQIRIHGHLDPQWKDWFEGLTLTLEDNGDTMLTGPVVDQAALHGLLKKVRDLAIPLLSVIRVEPTQPDGSESKSSNPSLPFEDATASANNGAHFTEQRVL